jgi:hypothetical protein
MSPKSMEPWIREKEEYVRLDYELAKHAPKLIGMDVLHALLDKKPKYSFDEAKKIQKMQYKKDDYLKLMDVTSGYSATRMLDILRDRCRYLIERCSTLNNPHIPASYIEERGQLISGNHAATLRAILRTMAEQAVSSERRAANMQSHMP